ncbi:pdgf/vegf receptor [Anopheles sinensis]|uniref:Ig-like domain-containing protein n=1 Tax=Anopheles sinensis TaxID=74873 RepID=A0A084W1Z0_ANOSI|nr:pdgf/vegf receptor [Anopheles sinensis]
MGVKNDSCEGQKWEKIDHQQEEMEFGVQSPADGVLYEDTLNITCSVDVYNFTNDVKIYPVPENVVARQHAKIYKPVRDRYAWTTAYEIHVSKDIFARIVQFECTAMNKLGSSLSKIKTVEFHDPIVPHITDGIKSRKIALTPDASTTLVCNVQGAPPPTISWRKNKIFHGTNNSIIVSLGENETMAEYECKGKNRLGSVNITWHIVPAGK